MQIIACFFSLGPNSSAGTMTWIVGGGQQLELEVCGRPGGMRRRAGGRAAGRQSAAALRASRSRAAAGPGDMPARRGRDPRAATAASSPRPVDVCTPRSSPISHAITRLTSTGM